MHLSQGILGWPRIFCCIMFAHTFALFNSWQNEVLRVLGEMYDWSQDE